MSARSDEERRNLDPLDPDYLGPRWEPPDPNRRRIDDLSAALKELHDAVWAVAGIEDPSQDEWKRFSDAADIASGLLDKRLEVECTSCGFRYLIAADEFEKGCVRCLHEVRISLVHPRAGT